MILEINDSDYINVSEILDSNNVEFISSDDKYYTWIGKLLWESLYDFMGQTDLLFSSEIAKSVYDLIPKMVIDIETQIVKDSCILEGGTEIYVLQLLLKDYFDKYILKVVDTIKVED